MEMYELFNEKIVGGYFSLVASIILASSIIIFDIYLIAFCAFIFGFGTANFLGIVLREGVKASQETLSVSVSNLMTIGFSGFIFGPALIGLELKNKEDIQPLLDRMKEKQLSFEYVNDHPKLFRFIA